MLLSVKICAYRRMLSGQFFTQFYSQQVNLAQFGYVRLDNFRQRLMFAAKSTRTLEGFP